MTPTTDFPRVVIPALLRHARSTYGRAMRSALEAAGFDDIPGNGLYLIGGLNMGPDRVPIGQLVREVGLSKQAAGQLVDTLVLRGYLARAVSETDRRQVLVTLTDRGRAAAETQAAARESIDAALTERVGQSDVNAARRALVALIAIGDEHRIDASGESR